MKAKMVIHLIEVNGNVTDVRTLDECFTSKVTAMVFPTATRERSML